MHCMTCVGMELRTELIRTILPDLDKNFALYPSSLFLTLSIRKLKDEVLLEFKSEGKPRYLPKETNSHTPRQ